MILTIRRVPGFLALATAIAFTTPAFAKCPIPDGGTLVIRAGAGDIHVDTSSRDSSVDVQVDNNAVQVQEICLKDVAQYIGNVPDQPGAVVAWRIVAPKTVNLDLVTQAGNITVGDVDANVVLRTAGGFVTAGNIKGRASLTTQGGFIKSGNIGGDAELRSQGGTLEVGDIGGDADLFTNAGFIRASNITGQVDAQGGRSISIVKAGSVKANATGDISIGDASRINAKSGGGNITSRRVRGPFQGRTEAGDIRLDSAGAWVEASTGTGNIFVRLVPENFDGDLHMNLQAGTGDVTVYLPSRLRASIDASVQRAAFQAQQIISEFPPVPPRPPAQGLGTNRFYAATHSQFVSNSGGNKIVLNTGLGKITIRKN
jgi:DUF4097 and DUF4098 domain-containing protein YvlB